MGTILQFQQPDASQQSAADVQALLRRSGKASADIIIFPGVRIERQSKPDAKAAPRKRAKKTARRKV